MFIIIIIIIIIIITVTVIVTVIVIIIIIIIIIIIESASKPIACKRNLPPYLIPDYPGNCIPSEVRTAGAGRVSTYNFSSFVPALTVQDIPSAPWSRETPAIPGSPQFRSLLELPVHLDLRSCPVFRVGLVRQASLETKR